MTAEHPEAQIYNASVKIEQTAKGAAMVTVHVYANDDNSARIRAGNLFLETIKSLKENGQLIAGAGA